MWLRLRQIALVAEHLAPVEQAIEAILGLSVCYRDPAVAEFGLENALFPIGNQFLEVVAPTQPGTAAGRFLQRRRGDGGYMVITQCDDHAPRRRRVEALGVRVAHEFVAEGFTNMQLHPQDTGGSFFEIDQQLGARGNELDGPWVPAGNNWQAHVRTERVSAIAAAELQVDNPSAVATRWAEIAELPVEVGGVASLIQLDNARLRFVGCADGRPAGLAGLDLVSHDRDAVLSAATEHGAPVDGNSFVACGMRWNLI
jgi:hypothetical protein